MTSRNGTGALRAVLQEARGPGVTMSDLTVLATQNDPYRVDTPANHRDGEWFADRLAEARPGAKPIHLRGLHYAIISREQVLKPNGEPYRNTDRDWTWLQSKASKAARWLGYVPFESITDERNDPPKVHRPEPLEEPWPYVHCDVRVEIPDPSEIEPRVGILGFRARQPYHLVLFGEKSSLAEVLLPIAQLREADLYLPTGEISDTLLYRMAREGAEDGRPMRVFTVADCDPAGHQMPISISRKLQALRDLEFHDLDFEVRPVALTVDQVHDLGLPSTPLKDTELRADAWRDAFGVEQTEVDALATLRPDALREIVENAIRPFYDPRLEVRVYQAEKAWREAAQRIVDEQTDAAGMAGLRTRAAAKLSELEEEIDALREGLRQAVPSQWGIEFPPVEIPGAEIDPSLHGKPLVSSAWPWGEQTESLIRRKTYEAMV